MSRFQKAGSALCCIVPPVVVVLASSIAHTLGSFRVSLYILNAGTLLYLALMFHRFLPAITARTESREGASGALRADLPIRINRHAARRHHLTAEELYRLEAVIACDDCQKVLAGRLRVSEQALRTSLSRAYGKLGIHNRAQITPRLIELDLIDLDPVDLADSLGVEP